MTAVEFLGASKTYSLPNKKQFTALKPLHLTIQKGECFGLLGHNGAGKTTAISLLAGIHSPTEGDVRVHGHNVSEEPEVTKRILGVVQQELIADSFFPLPTMLR